MSIPNVRELLTDNWRPIALYGGLFAFLATLLLLRLDSLLPGYSTSAVQAYQHGLDLKGILDNPLNAPFSLLAYAVSQLHSGHSLLIMRYLTAGLGLVTLIIFCGLLRYWHDARTACFGTLLLGTSSWFLFAGRSGTPVILMFGLFALVACGVWLRATSSPWAVLLGLILAGALLYVPGMIWLIGLGIVWQWKSLDKAFKKQLVAVTAGGLGFVALIAPLGWSLYHSPKLIKPLLNLPADGWPAPLTVLHNLIDVPLHIFIRGQTDASTILSQVPMLDFFATVMFLLGGYVYLTRIGLRRSHLLIAIFVGSTAVISLGGRLGLTVLIPFLYLVIAVGVSYMLGQWFKVFPRNPIAQSIGTLAMGAVILLAVGYHLRLYYTAWPNAHSTRTVYTEKEIKP